VTRHEANYASGSSFTLPLVCRLGLQQNVISVDQQKMCWISPFLLCHCW